MKLIVGLGNPGEQYSRTRHNIGFMVADALAERWKTGPWKSKEQAAVAEWRGGGEPVQLVKPLTYMNLSGQSVGALVRWHKLAIGDVIAVYDDMDLPLGKLRLRNGGGSGGHRGVESMKSHLGGDGFCRIRVGIGRPAPGQEVPDYVLSRFRQEEQAVLDAVIGRAADAVECILKEGFTKAMNKFN